MSCWLACPLLLGTTSKRLATMFPWEMWSSQKHISRTSPTQPKILFGECYKVNQSKCSSILTMTWCAALPGYIDLHIITTWMSREQPPFRPPPPPSHTAPLSFQGLAWCFARMDPGFCYQGFEFWSAKAQESRGILGYAPPEKCWNLEHQRHHFLDF